MGNFMINNYKSSHVEKFKKLKAPEKDGFYTYIYCFAETAPYTLDGRSISLKELMHTIEETVQNTLVRDFQ